MRKSVAIIIILVWSSILVPRIVAQEPEAGPGSCLEIQRESLLKTRPAPTVKGKTYQVPKLKIRVFDNTTGTPWSNKAIGVNYWWSYFESDGMRPGRDSIQCKTDSFGEVLVPSHEVTPVGWDNPPWWLRTLIGKPRFENIEIGIGTILANGSGRVRLVELKRSELKNKMKNGIAQIELNSAGIENP